LIHSSIYRTVQKSNQQGYSHPSVYIALSYNWGSNAGGVDILLNQRRIRVTKNLAAALRVFRADKNISSFWFWIDALCINQNDINERNCQVKRMIEIYRSAHYVLVWLGPETDNSEMAFGVMETVHQSLIENLEANELPLGFHYDSLKADEWASFCDLLNRPYWSRIWVIQELAACDETDIIVCWGRHGIAMDRLIAVLHCMSATMQHWDATSAKFNEAEWKINAPRLLLNTLPLLGLVGTATRIQSANEPEEPVVKHKRMMMAMKNAQSTDPRDMIYGLMGLLDFKLAARIEPDYKASLESVYAEYTRATITTREDLSIIYQHGPGKLRQIDWPSWVPDFRSLNSKDIPSPLSEKGFSAGGSWAPILFSDDGMTLICQGVVVDELEDCVFSPFCKDMEKFDEHSKVDLSRCLRRILIEAPFKGWKTGSMPLVSLADLLKPYPANDAARTFFRRNDCVLVKDAPLKQWLIELGTAATKPAIDEPRSKAEIDARYKAEMSEVWEWLWIRTVITTKAGRLGIGTRDAREGDKVAILKGSHVPLLLRPSGTGFRVVGACYVDGLMDGEALRDPGIIRKMGKLLIN
jgi:hypothetical protein